MRTVRIFTSETLREQQSLCLDERATHYLLNVLRCKTGDKLCLFNGDGFDYSASITLAKKRCIEVLVNDSISNHSESALHITLAIGISKGDRMDWAIQKATEMGVQCIQPLITDRVNVKLDHRQEKKHAHWRGIIISACEQSGRAKLPLLKPAVNLTEWISSTEETDIQWAFTPQGISIQGASKKAKKIINSASLVIGPEGGLSDSDLAQINKANFIQVNLGPRILRTETAPIAALTLLQSLWGDLR